CKEARINKNKFIADNLQVGGPLDLRGTQITALPDNLQVGGSLYLQYGRSWYIGADIHLDHLKNRIFVSADGGWIIADGIKTEIISHHSNVYRVRKIAHREIEYLITDGVGNWSHGETIEEAREDLLYKITDRKKSDYEGLTAESELAHGDAVKCYRVITGACSAGMKHFLKAVLGDRKQEIYTIAEIAKLTEGQYGHSSFVSFFKL
ncbi:MAG: hypothetical protein SNH18_09510, partial [Rikenellaceae bacterium]